MTRLTLLTPRTPGAVAILQLHGDSVRSVLEQLTGKADWFAGRLRLSRFTGIDEGLAVLLPGASDTAQLMPHGGPRVVQRLIEHLVEQLGVTYDPTPGPRKLYPESKSEIEADMLDAIARAASPAAIDLLAAQPRRWRDLLAAPEQAAAQRSVLQQRSAVLDQLIHPPTVVVIGPANAGKSTLTNRLMGRSVSIVADLPGTTRDWVGGLVELAGQSGAGIAVRWLDTPGLRDSSDPIEQRAIALAKRVISDATVVVALRDPGQAWPDRAELPRQPDLWVVNKIDKTEEDLGGATGSSADDPLRISAMHGTGVGALEDRVIHLLGLSDLEATCWAFSPRLRAWCERKDDLQGYVD
ncbi:MAG: GTPase [Planctomycetota bacterium]